MITYLKRAVLVIPRIPLSTCLVVRDESLEDIDYSICTLEFETRRESYYWLLEALDLYRPMVYEFARLNITRTVCGPNQMPFLQLKIHITRWWN